MSAVLAPPMPPATATAAVPARAGRLTMSLKPLLPELSETILPASIAKSPQPSPRASTPAPIGESADVLDLPMTIGEDPPVDLGPPFGPENNRPTDPVLARPAPSGPAKPRR
jgi:hypothetical protein